MRHIYLNQLLIKIDVQKYGKNVEEKFVNNTT